MLELALADLPGLLLDTREVRRAAQGGAPSYTVDTLHEVRAQLGPPSPSPGCWVPMPSLACPAGMSGPNSSGWRIW